ncbi:MAG: 2-dehydropantoate 2-reductase [Firmicutes bacterium]|nr:2-dehydropantoate 2-reductase [Bacillota bacterium]
MRIAILGSGGVASVLAWALREHEVTVIARRPFRRFRLIGSGIAGGSVSFPVSVRDWEDPTDAAWDSVWVAVKAPALPAVARWLDRNASVAPVLLWMNGMGQEHYLETARHGPLWPVVVTMAVSGLRHGPTTRAFHLHTLGVSYLPQAAYSALAPLYDALQHSLAWRWEWLDDEALRRRRWVKLVQNSIINPLTALAGIPNGRLPRHPLFAFAPPLAAEARAVAEREGVALSPNLVDEVAHLAQATAGNRSSMLQDVLGGRPTEIDAINGYIVYTGHQHGLQCPTHEALVQLFHRWPKTPPLP